MAPVPDRHPSASPLHDPSPRPGSTRSPGQLTIALVALGPPARPAAGRGAQRRGPGTTPPRGADGPAEAFSSSRAATAAAPIVSRPRPIGSSANDAARETLSSHLEDAGLSVREVEGMGDFAAQGEGSAGYTRSLVATRPGTDPTGTIVLATHIDSVPGAPGAADAGVGIAVILESLRALGPEAARNDLVVLLVDGEEDGLLRDRRGRTQPPGRLRGRPRDRRRVSALSPARGRSP
ncbi:hypothetical protein DEO23_13445 [Brachybacterium endophyticum]|uniref:Peptidase M28 domain-containing protein n=1 Tax=Brachybacterium endophyticum TaxID=2182385 RepID=A0A2U2RI77_9MICO|nr:M28 family peptidase [Brachybacterium endophyticum]PWH05558.1 hypothetical protein DEO23_13445 [Brachybacterium endophyticum]